MDHRGSRHFHTRLPGAGRIDRQSLARLGPYLWEYRGRVIMALAFLMLSKVATVAVPLVLKDIVDHLGGQGPLVLPLALLAGYGALRLAGGLFTELRDVVFTKVRHRAVRRISVQVLEHLHTLSLRFHLDRKTGAVARDIQRGTQSVSSLLNYLVFSILPILAEFALVAVVLLSRYDASFAAVTFVTVGVYVAYTLAITEWRMRFRVVMNQMDSLANSQAIDSLINYETVKYFGNDRLERDRYDASLAGWEDAAIKSQNSMALLNAGQGAIIAAGVTVLMILAGQGVVDGSMTIGDLVLVNAFLIQLFLPLNFLGVVYSQFKHALSDMDEMFRLLGREPEVRDAPDARSLVVSRGEVRFERVEFAYDPERPILHGVDFAIPAGHKVAVVGSSGAGKSTLARLLFRFYDVSGGRVLIDGQDVRGVTRDSLRAAIGVMPQDTVLFNETIRYNIAYARPGATEAEIERAARLAHIHEFIAALPQGYETVVGERGLKLSGGEKQRVAIARVILKNPPILIFDEATSSLDSESEKAIQAALREVAEHHTTLVIAHRLSTIVDADEILVLEDGRIAERGTHARLLAVQGRYAELWRLQERADQDRLPAD